MKKFQFQKVARLVDPTRHNEYRAYLKAVYEKLKEHFPDLTYETFSDQIGLGRCNAACLIINGRRSLSLKAAGKVVRNLGLTGDTRKYFLALVSLGTARSNEGIDESLKGLLELKTQVLPTQLDGKQLSFYEHWYNAVLLELLQLPGARPDPQWLSQRLIGRVTPAKAQEALDLMVELGLLAADPGGDGLRPTKKTLSTGSEVIGLAIFAFHQQMIDLAKKAMTDVTGSERDISALTVAADANMQKQLKEEIGAFRKRILAMSERCVKPDRVLQVNFQMFPVTRGARAPRTAKAEKKASGQGNDQ